MTDKELQLLRTDIKELSSHADSAAETVRNLYITMLLFGTYLAIIIGATNNEQLLLGSSIALPVLDVKLPIAGIYMIAPGLFVLMHANLLLQLYLLSRKLHPLRQKIASLPSEADADLARNAIFQFPFSHIIIGQRGDRSIRLILHFVVTTTIILMPLALLVAALVRYLPAHEPVITNWHRILILCNICLLWYFWPKIITDRNARADDSSERRRLNWRDPAVLKQYGLLIFSVLSVGYCLTFLSYPGEFVEKATSKNVVRHLFGPDEPDQHKTYEISRDWWQRPFAYRNLRLPERVLVRLAPSREDIAKIVSVGKTEDDAYVQLADHLVLRKRDLNYAVLKKSKLYRVDLRDSSLQHADLSGAKLQLAQLNNANLDNANLRNADLRGANLYSTSLVNADLTGANLSGVDLTSANLSGAILENAELTNAKLGGSKLYGSNLRRADLRGADLKYANLKASRLAEADLRGAHLQGARLDGAILTLARLEGANLADASVTGADLSWTRIWYTAAPPVLRSEFMIITTDAIIKLPEEDLADLQKFKASVLDKQARADRNEDSEPVLSWIELLLDQDRSNKWATSESHRIWLSLAQPGRRNFRKRKEYLAKLACEKGEALDESGTRFAGPFLANSIAHMLLEDEEGSEEAPQPANKQLAQDLSNTNCKSAASLPVSLMGRVCEVAAWSKGQPSYETCKTAMNSLAVVDQGTSQAALN